MMGYWFPCACAALLTVTACGGGSSSPAGSAASGSGSGGPASGGAGASSGSSGPSSGTTPAGGVGGGGVNGNGVSGAVGSGGSSGGAGAGGASSSGTDSSSAGSSGAQSGSGATSSSSGGAGSSGSQSGGGGTSSSSSGGNAAGPPDSGGGGQGPMGGKDSGIAPPPGGGNNPGGVSYPYVFSVFDDSAPVSDLKIYTSNDALNFTLLYDTGYTGPSGFLRDPSIMKNTDGKFYVAFTTPPTIGCCGAESSFSIASSSDLKTWTTVSTVPAGVAGVKNTWAPEWFKDTDGSVYAIVNVDGKTYAYKAMDATMKTFSAPTWIGIGPGYIDTFIVTIGTTYHAFTKNNATYVEHATATALTGPWTFVGQNDWAGWGMHKEAPALILLPNGTWRFYTDAGSSGHEMYSDSADVFKTWTAPQTLPGVGNNISHGTVIKGN